MKVLLQAQPGGLAWDCMAAHPTHLVLLLKSVGIRFYVFFPHFGKPSSVPTCREHSSLKINGVNLTKV